MRDPNLFRRRQRVGYESAPGLNRVAHRTQRLADILRGGGEQRRGPRALPAARGVVTGI